MTIRILLTATFLTAFCFGQTTLSTWRTRAESDPALTASDRLKILFHNDLASPGAFFRAVGPALGNQINNKPEEWNRTAAGFGRRVGFNAVRFTSRDLIEAGATAALGYDPRYQRCNCTGGMRRVGHALSGMVLSADSHGKRRFDPSHLIAAYGAGYISANLYPSSYRVSVKGPQLGHQMAAQIGVENLFFEFAPDIKRFFRRTVLRKP